MKLSLMLMLILLQLTPMQALALTDVQRQGMRFHGSWDWVVKNCPGFHRSYGYWFALKEVGGFRNQMEILENEPGVEYRDGWNLMRDRAGLNSVRATCDFAFETWPAVFIRSDQVH